MERRGECPTLAGDGLQRVGPMIDYPARRRKGAGSETEVGRAMRSSVRHVPVGTGHAQAWPMVKDMGKGGDR